MYQAGNGITFDIFIRNSQIRIQCVRHFFNLDPVPSQDTQIGTNRIPVVDHHNVQVIGSDVNVPVDTGSGSPVVGGYTEHIVWFNKPQGIFRLLGVKSSNNPTPAAQGSNSPAEASAVKSK